MDTVKALQQLGFTEYEARAYTTLVAEGALNGYSLAKKTGIPRANIYAVVEKLASRGAILRAEGHAGQHYTAIPPEQLLQSLESAHKRALNVAGHSLTRQVRRQPPAAIFNLRGEELLARAEQLIDAAKQALLIALQPPEAGKLAGPLRMAQERGVRITTLCLHACETVCPACRGDTHRHALAPADDTRWLVMVTDHAITLVGQFDDDGAYGMTTHQPLVVELATAFIRQNLALAALCKEMTGHAEDLLPESVLAQLNDLYPDGGFPAYLRALGAKVSG